jgi:FK506-binding protein 3
MADVLPPYTNEVLVSDSVSKKDLVTFLQANSSQQFLVNQKLKGAAKNVMKTKTKDQLVEDYKLLFSSKDFKVEGEETIAPTAATKDGHSNEVDIISEKAKKLEIKQHNQESVKYTKKILKNGNKTRYPMKGDEVECYYTGKLENGTVFDTNIDTLDKRGKKSAPLKFKVGVGKVIRGWDEALMAMSQGEVAELVIQSEWAYGKKGVEGKVPPNSTLIFHVELVSVC